MSTDSPNSKRKESNRRAQQFLSSAKLLDSCNSAQKLLFLEHNWTVARALKELGQRHILSAPVVINPDLEDISEAESGSLPEPTFLGWIDVVTILQAFLKGIQQKHEPMPDKMLQLMPILESEGKTFTEKSLLNIADAQDKELVFQADANTSLLGAIRDMFLKNYTFPGQGGVHRVAVFNAHGAITCIVSQLDIMRFLLTHVWELGYIANETVEALGLLADSASALVLDHAIPTLIAFQKMLAKGMTGAAIKAEGDQIIANLSISDLRCIQAEHFGKLALPVAEFLALTHDTAYAGYAASGSGNLDQIQEEPFYGASAGSPAVSSPPLSSPRKASLARLSPSSPSKSPRKAHTASPGAAHLDRINTGIHDEVKQPITCTATSTLEQVMGLMVNNSVHRIYIEQEQNQAAPQQSITPTDVMHVLSVMST